MTDMDKKINNLENFESFKDDMHEVWLTVKSRQVLKDEEPVETDLSTEGYYMEKDGSIFLFYQETSMTSDFNSKVVLRLKNNTVNMGRYGEMETHLHFEVGKRDTTIYKTPYGQFKVELLTDSLKIEADSDTGNVDIDYSISISGAPIIKNYLNINYRRN